MTHILLFPTFPGSDAPLAETHGPDIFEGKLPPTDLQDTARKAAKPAAQVAQPQNAPNQ